ncbi:MAG: DUF2065 domain-containing protein [Alphaproteobacteria bacterium]|nr:DUF2065 domain-containing protein [Alphaproteobacteria bacterium]MBO4643051.1 DUF2065 domain-containing protein [Alphaproteobacteria bacterium]
MQDLIVACLMAFVIEGIYYALMPERAQEAMRKLAQVEPEMLRKAGILVAIIGVMIINVIKR